MNETFAVWALILLSLVTANLPFVIERPLLLLPWQDSGAHRPGWLRWIESILFFGALLGLGYTTLTLISTGFLAGGASGLAFFATILVLIAVAVAIMLYPGWRIRSSGPHKSFLSRLLEVLVLYGLVGVLGVAFESNIGNRFAQTWEFYAVTLSLYLVLGYPGFVFRYLMRRRKVAARSV